MPEERRPPHLLHRAAYTFPFPPTSQEQAFKPKAKTYWPVLLLISKPPRSTQTTIRKKSKGSCNQIAGALTLIGCRLSNQSDECLRLQAKCGNDQSISTLQASGST